MRTVTAAVLDIHMERNAEPTSIAEKSISGLLPAQETIAAAANLSRPTRVIASAMRNPAKNNTMIGWANGDTAAPAEAAPPARRTTGMVRDVT